MHARPIPRSLVAVARSDFGLVTRTDLDAHGVTSRRRARALDGGELVEVHPGVYRFASHPETFEGRCRAANLAAPRAALSGPTAARLYGLRRAWSDDVHVLCRHAIDLHGVVGHRTNMLTEQDVRPHGAFRVLRPARLACDLAAFVDDADLDSIIEQMVQRRLTDVVTIRRLARTFITSGRNGAARLARVLDGRPTWRRPADSDLEVRLRRALERRGLRLEPQVAVELDSGRTIRVDLGDPATKFGIEVDHVTWHGGRLDVQRDKARDRDAMRLGWAIARVTDEDIDHRLERIADELVAIAHVHAARAA